MKKRNTIPYLVLTGTAISVLLLSGCSNTDRSDGKTVVRMLQYKPEAVDAFEEMEERFNAEHDDIVLKIESPNEAMTVLKTRLIKEDYPDIVGIGGDINYSNFLDADLFMDISDFEGISDIKPSYMQIEKDLEFIPQEGIYALPYAANCAGILYNRDMFEEHGWEIPETWSEFTDLCEEIQSTTNIYPLYFGYKDTWTCLAPWNALAVGLADSDICSQVNLGNGIGYSVREVIETARAVTGHSIPAIETERRAGDPARLVASSEKARKVLGWNPVHDSLEEIIASAWNWHKDHPNGYEE